MIIKSMSRKDQSFGGLIDYMTDVAKSDEQYFVFHNLYARSTEAMTQEYLDNAKHVHRRKNGVYLYHEILSIQCTDKIDRERQKAILKNIAYDYAHCRAPNCLVFGTLHDDHDEHLHYHLLISANYVGESKKHRFSKAEFAAFKNALEERVLAQYPELEQSITMNRQAGEKLSHKGAEQQRRTGQTPQRDALKEKLTKIFNSAKDKQELFTELGKAGFELYHRGNTVGVTDTEHGRNHRLKTLGLLDAFNGLSDRIELAEKAKAKDRVENQQREEQVQAEPEQEAEQETTEQSQQSQESKEEAQSDTTEQTSQTEDDPVQAARERHKKESEARKQQKEAQAKDDKDQDSKGRKQ